MGRGRRHKWLGWWLLFSLSPLSQDPFKGLDVAAACFFFPRGWPVFLRENSNPGLVESDRRMRSERISVKISFKIAYKTNSKNEA